MTEEEEWGRVKTMGHCTTICVESETSARHQWDQESKDYNYAEIIVVDNKVDVPSSISGGFAYVSRKNELLLPRFKKTDAAEPPSPSDQLETLCYVSSFNRRSRLMELTTLSNMADSKDGDGSQKKKITFFIN